MRSKLLLSALALIAVAIALALANIAQNRRGKPDATLVLTERELPRALGRARFGESNSMALDLRYPFEILKWINAEKLQAIGFDPVTQDADRYKRTPSHQAYVVFEFEGPRWAELISKQEEEVAKVRAQMTSAKASENDLKRVSDQLSRLRMTESRLVPIDVGPDGRALRALYPDGSRYLITAAEIEVYINYGYSGDKRPQGRIGRILTNPIHVPDRFQAALAQATKNTSRDQAPRYHVTVHYGKRFEPWIVDVQPMEIPASPVNARE